MTDKNLKTPVQNDLEVNVPSACQRIDTEIAVTPAGDVQRPLTHVPSGGVS
jgi:hypothetical protein